MKREIIFRGKSIDNGEWVEGWYIGYSEHQGYIYGDYVDKEEIWKVFNKTVGQYTGLKDKNGVKIFEGDILKVISHDSYGEDDEILAEIKFNTCAFCLYNEKEDIDAWLGTLTFYENDDEKDEWEVIGNIHDNKREWKNYLRWERNWTKRKGIE